MEEKNYTQQVEELLKLPQSLCKQCGQCCNAVIFKYGLTYEEIIELSKDKPIYKEFLKLVDVLVDGKFILKERDLNLLFRGSRNQRLIVVPKTLKRKKVVLFDEKKYRET